MVDSELVETPEDVARRRAATIPTRWIWTALGVYALALGLYWWAVSTFAEKKLDAAGQFGDMFGGFNALASGLAMLGVIGALYLQRKQNEMQADELRLQRIELAQTRQELAGQKEALEAQNAQQQRTAEAALMQQFREEYDSLEGPLATLKHWNSKYGSDAPSRLVELLAMTPPAPHPELQAERSDALSTDHERNRVSRFFNKIQTLAGNSYIDNRLVAISLDRRAVVDFLGYVEPLDRAILGEHYSMRNRDFFELLLLREYPQEVGLPHLGPTSAVYPPSVSTDPTS